MKGRCFSVGKLTKERRGNGPERWVLDWRMADGTRQRVALSTDRRVAERKRAELVRSRDLQLMGLGTEEGQERKLTEIRDLYLNALKATASKAHVVSVTAGLKRIMDSIGAVRVRDVLPHRLMMHRTARLADEISVRTVNLEVGIFKTMLTWAVQAGLIAQSARPRQRRSKAGPRVRSGRGVSAASACLRLRCGKPSSKPARAMVS